MPDAALSLVARSARGAYRDAVSTLDQLAAATGGEDHRAGRAPAARRGRGGGALPVCDLVVDRDTAGALTFIEELSEQGQDLGRLVTDLLEHLRHLMLVQHMGEVPESLPVTEETRERLRAQANQLGEPTRSAADRPARRRGRRHAPGRRPAPAARARARQGDAAGGGPLARVARLPARAARAARPHGEPHQRCPSHRGTRPRQTPAAPSRAPAVGAAPDVELEQLQEAWQRTILPAVEERSIPTASVLARGAAGRARGRHARRSSSRRSAVPPQARRGAEERDAARATRSTRSRAASSRVAFELGERGREAGRARRGAGRRGGDRRAAEDDLRRAGDRANDHEHGHEQADAAGRSRCRSRWRRPRRSSTNETVEASAGGGMVTVKANGAGEIVEITIAPEAIDPDDPEACSRDLSSRR